MSNLIRIKRRAVGGAAGAPASLANAELAYNEQDDVLYYGFGTGGANGTATAVKPIAGSGYVVSLNGSYANPSWITSLAGSKISGPITGLAVGTDVQAYDADLSAIAALTGLTGLLRKTAANTWTLDTASTLAGYGITDAYTKVEVDTLVQGLDPKASVVAASTANITSLSGTMTIDDVPLAIGDRVLLKNQTAPAQNGVYVVSDSAWARSADMNSWSKLPSAYLFVEKGTINADIGFVCTSDQGGTLETTAITFAQFNGAGQVIAGAGLTKTGSQLDIISASSDRIVVNSDSIDLATLGTAGTYRSVTVDAYGRVSAGTNPTTLSGYGITDAQSLDATLTALANLTTAANQLIYSTGVDTFAMTSFTMFGRSLVDDPDASTARTTLGLGSIAVQASDNVNITGGSITNLTTFDGVTVDCGTF